MPDINDKKACDAALGEMLSTGGDPGCPKGHVWVTYSNARVSVCQNCGADRPVAELAKDDPLRKYQPK